jgi:ammonium transporter
LIRLLLPVIALLALLPNYCPLRADEPPKADLAVAKDSAKENPPPAAPAIDGADTAWMLVSTGLVMFMVPGLALFYGGIARRKNLLGTMMHSMVALAIVGVQWLLLGYMLAFGASQSGIFGWDFKLLALHGVDSGQPFVGTKIPIFVHCMYQGMFAIITPALISGALAERIRFGPYCLFIALWSALIYCPLAHWVWGVGPDPVDPTKSIPVGWLGKMGALDFAGGTVVHIAAGVSGLAAILLLRKRVGYPEHAMHPNSMVLTLFGAGVLWFGWFGFNGGSGLGSGGLAGSALTATQVAAASAALAWMLIEWAHRGKPTALGLATGLVAGLVAVTPASGFVPPWGALLVGIAASAVCYVMVTLKPKFKYDDSLDAFGVHGIGGFLGAVLTGVFVSAALYKAGAGSDLPDVSPILKGDRVGQILVQFAAAAVAVAFAFVGTAVLVKVIDLTFGFCLSPQAEDSGLDQAVHGEVAFDFGMATESVGVVGPAEPRPAKAPPKGGHRYSVVVEGSNNGELMRTWSDLCKITPEPPSAEFSAVYPYVTTVSGNRFRFVGGDPQRVSQSLETLFGKRMPHRKIAAKLVGGE